MMIGKSTCHSTTVGIPVSVGVTTGVSVAGVSVGVGVDRDDVRVAVSVGVHVAESVGVWSLAGRMRATSAARTD